MLENNFRVNGDEDLELAISETMRLTCLGLKFFFLKFFFVFILHLFFEIFFTFFLKAIGGVRQGMEDNFKIGDYTFKKGSILFVSHLATSLDESIWVKKKKKNV